MIPLRQPLSIKITGKLMGRYFLRKRQARWSTPPRSEKSSRTLLSLTKSYQPKSLTSHTSLAMYSPISSDIAFIWGLGRVAWSLILPGNDIASPCSPSGRG